MEIYLADKNDYPLVKHIVYHTIETIYPNYYPSRGCPVFSCASSWQCPPPSPGSRRSLSFKVPETMGGYCQQNGNAISRLFRFASIPGNGMRNPPNGRDGIFHFFGI